MMDKDQARTVRHTHNLLTNIIAMSDSRIIKNMARNARNYFDEVVRHMNRSRITHWDVQLLVNRRALWLGIHHSKYNKRWCINIVPCITVAITAPGGIKP